jgi:hypothetical protein
MCGSGQLDPAAGVDAEVPGAVLPGHVSGVRMVAGWMSHLLDRLGFHDRTAPGTGRGALNFIQINRGLYNVADLVILAATPLCLLAVRHLRRSLGRSATTRQAEHPDVQPIPMTAVAVALCLVMIVAAGPAT